MVKDIKYIIKRILIGVGVVLVLSFLRGNLLISAKALEPINVSPNGMCWYSGGVAPNGCYLTPTQFNISWTTFYGNQFGADGSVERFFWRYHGSNIGGKYYNIDLLFYNGDKSSYLESNRGYIQNSVNNTFSCRIDNTRWGQASSDGSSNASSTGTATVHCDNVYLTDDYFTFWFVDGSKRSQSIYAVTDATLTPTSQQSVINNQNENTQQQIQNQNENTQQQIQNQNDNTKKQIESQSVCKNLSIKDATLDGFLVSNGNFYSQTGFNKTTPFITLNGINKITLLKKATTNKYICFYDSSQVNINCIDTSTLSNNSDITIPSNASYFRANFEVSNSLPVFSVCSNGNQSIVNSNEQLNNTLNDDTGGDVSSSWFDDFKSNSSTPVSDLLTMPITLLQAYLDGFSGTCKSMNLGKLYDSYIIIPCINISNYLGDDLWSLIDVLFSIFMVYNIGMLCVTIYEGITGLQDDMQFLYSPRHAGAGDTRVERYGDDY